MTTARDLALVVLGMPADRQRDLSLALAGAEGIDLLERGALRLDGDRMVPGSEPAGEDPLLSRAFTGIRRQRPYETVGEWIRRHGIGLAEAYAGELESTGLLVRPRGRGILARPAPVLPADSPEHRRADERLASGEPVLTALVGVLDTGGIPADVDTGNAVSTVLAAVAETVTAVEAARLRRYVEDAAFDNIWRA
ncbi:GPP34 family phosphoprotein [Streptomyces sp. NPDC060184]|uniref:GOLPH3/VPS74 family protein n=1 Tax=Streptomyces sp. NPDC060184 TaxID=3347064 RepID=UPI0036518D74